MIASSMFMKRLFSFAFLTCLAGAGAQGLAITNARVITGNGTVIDQG
jgi:hypothetical protein